MPIGAQNARKSLYVTKEVEDGSATKQSVWIALRDTNSTMVAGWYPGL